MEMQHVLIKLATWYVIFRSMKIEYIQKFLIFIGYLFPTFVAALVGFFYNLRVLRLDEDTIEVIQFTQDGVLRNDLIWYYHIVDFNIPENANYSIVYRRLGNTYITYIWENKYTIYKLIAPLVIQVAPVQEIMFNQISLIEETEGKKKD
jgi:hypothetical protein